MDPNTTKQVYGYRRLRVWEAADQFAHAVYRLTTTFPAIEQFGLTAQLRRAALSVPTNIVEGHARKGRRELRRFAGIALGSLAESEYLLEFARAEGYLKDADYGAVEGLRNEVGRLLWVFHASL